MKDVTRILNAIEQGEAGATDELLPLVYEELRLLAAQKLSQEKPGQTLEATALVHEAYIRLVGDEAQKWDSRGHFFIAASEAMRRILVEIARRKQRLKHGGGRRRIAFDDAVSRASRSAGSGQACTRFEGGTPSTRFDDLIALDEALMKLSRKDKVKADLVKLRFFAGLTGGQAAKVLGISHNTCDRYWAYARSWLHLEITKAERTNQD